MDSPSFVFPARLMLHGRVNHGGQLLDEKPGISASTNFGPTSGCGRVSGSPPQQSRKVGVIGLGDGRLSLEREAPHGCDVPAIDAFSGDSIPMHLLPREAMAPYL